MAQLHYGAMLAILLTLAMNRICKGQLSVRFTESDYVSTISASSVQVLISKTGNNAGIITIRIIPLTFSGYAQQSSMQCESNVVSQFRSSIAAEEDDFDSAVLEQVIPRSQTGISSTYAFNVTLRPDNVLEGEEGFVIVLNVTSENENDVVESSRACAIVMIREAPFTGPLVNFVRNGVILSPNNVDDVVLLEDAGNVTLFTVVKVIDTELPLMVTVTTRVTNDVMRGSDFIVPVTSIDILPEELSTDIIVTIIDDGLAEPNEMFSMNVRVSPVGHVFFQRQTILVEIIDNEEITIGIKNSEDVITVTEGESATVKVGLINFDSQNYKRFEVLLGVSIADQTAIAGRDYNRLVPLFFLPFLPDQSFNIKTIKRVGIESARKFIFEFVSDPLHLTIFERRNITIIITDSSEIPLAPSIDNLSMNNSVIETLWTQEVTDNRPVDNFTVIVKACSSSPCKIRDPQMPKDDELEYPVDKNLSVHLLKGVETRKVHEVVVCAVNGLGRNCSAPAFLEKDPITEFDVPLAPSIDNLLMMKDSTIETSWTHEITEVRPINNFIVIIKACSSSPCEIKDPYMPEEDEHEFLVDKNVLFYLLTVDPSKVHVILVCANNSMGRNCSAPGIPEKDLVILGGDSIERSEPTTKPPLILIVGIVVVGFLVLLFLLTAILLISIFCKRNKSGAYLPGKSIGKHIQGMSIDSNLEDDYVSNMKYL